MVEMLDKFSRRLQLSGYPLKLVERILKNGIVCFERKTKKFKDEGREFHRPEDDGKIGRRIGKMMRKSRWFRPNEAGVKLVGKTHMSGSKKRGSPAPDENLKNGGERSL